MSNPDQVVDKLCFMWNKIILGVPCVNKFCVSGLLLVKPNTYSTRFISIWVREKYDGLIGIKVLPFLLNNKNDVNFPKLNNGKTFSNVSASIHQ